MTATSSSCFEVSLLIFNGRGTKQKVEVKREDQTQERVERERAMESPPDNDVCSVCHDSFSLPCQANCSHWFCGKISPFYL